MSSDRPTAPPADMARDARTGSQPDRRAALRRGMGSSIKNMVYSVLAVFGLALAWWALMPDADQVQRQPVQVAPVADYAATQSDWPVLAPEGLPEGWTPTSVRFEPYTDGVVSWRVGYLTPQEEFVAIAQGSEVTDEWVASLVRGGRPDGSVMIAGPTGAAEWDRYVAEDQNALVLPATGPQEATTVIHGTAELAVLEDFIEHLQPVPGGA